MVAVQQLVMVLIPHLLVPFNYPNVAADHAFSLSELDCAATISGDFKCARFKPAPAFIITATSLSDNVGDASAAATNGKSTPACASHYTDAAAADRDASPTDGGGGQKTGDDAASWNLHKSRQRLEHALRCALTPPAVTAVRVIAGQQGGLQFLVRLRTDLQAVIR